MTAIPVLEATLEVDGAVADCDRAATVVQALRGSFPNLERESRIGAVLRFGWAPAPTAVARRLPLEDSLAATPA